MAPAAKQDGKAVAVVILSLEGADPLNADEDLETLRLLYQLGLRHTLIARKSRNAFGALGALWTGTEWREGYALPGLEDVGKVGNPARGLPARGYGGEDIQGILGRELLEGVQSCGVVCVAKAAQPAVREAASERRAR